MPRMSLSPNRSGLPRGGVRPSSPNGVRLIHEWRRGPERVSRHVQETMAARGNLAVACEAAGDRTGPFPFMPG
jgi:hypothetical protein